MQKSGLNEVHGRMQNVIDMLDAAAKKYPIKALAPMLKSDVTRARAESTLRAELNQTEGYKLGLITSIMIMAKTGDVSALDEVESIFNRTAFDMPNVTPGDPAPLIDLISKLSKNFSQTIQKVAQSLSNNMLKHEETQSCIKELDDLMKVSIEFKATFLKLSEDL